MSGLPNERGRQSHQRPRWGVAAVVLLIHLALVAALVRAFTPDVASSVVRSVTQAFTIDATLPETPEASPAAAPVKAPPKEEGAAAPAGRKATPRPVAVPSAPVAIRPTQAPPVAAQGTANAAGAAASGTGTGAGGEGIGTGSGVGGTGTGGGGSGTPTVKIAGEINSARDYARRGRDLRIGASVTIDLAIATDGRVKGCRVVQASPDPEADSMTCRLAMKRFRFRPARNAAGDPVEATYRWRQRWYY